MAGWGHRASACRRKVWAQRVTNPSGRPDLSVVIPIKNEADGLRELLSRLRGVLDAAVPSYEILAIDDGSTDQTLANLIAAQAQYPTLRIIELSRNFGKEAALAAGLDHAIGSVIVCMDADLQDPPEVIPTMLEQLELGFDTVVAKRTRRQGDGWMKRVTASLFYKVFNRICSVTLPDNVGDFRVMRRDVVDALRSLPESVRFHRGLYAWVGFKQTSVCFERPSRAAGRPKWGLRHMFAYAVDGLTSFSSFPVRLIQASAVTLIACLGVLAFFGVSVGQGGMWLPAVNLLAVGLVGEFVVRTLRESKRRPHYLIRQHYPQSGAQPQAASSPRWTTKMVGRISAR